jgi:hypothetical protein
MIPSSSNINTTQICGTRALKNALNLGSANITNLTPYELNKINPSLGLTAVINVPIPVVNLNKISSISMFQSSFHIINIQWNDPLTSAIVGPALSSSDLNTMNNYLQYALSQIKQYVSLEYGVSSSTVGSTYNNISNTLPNTGSNVITSSQIGTAVDQLCSILGISSSDCVIVPVLYGGIYIQYDGYTGGSYAGFHSVTPNGRPFVVFTVFAGTGFSPLTLLDSSAQYATSLSHEVTETIVDPRANWSNPEVCDPCASNCGTTYLDAFDINSNYLSSFTSSNLPPIGTLFYISAICKKASVLQCPAPSQSCAYSNLPPSAISSTPIPTTPINLSNLYIRPP